MPILSIVILNWNTSNLLSNCINTIQEHTHGLEYETIVVDNGSTDGSPKMVRDEFPDVTLIETGENLGFSRGNNIGIRAAKGEMILILNSDVLLRENALLPWVEFLCSRDDAAGAICRVEGANGQRQVNFLRFPTVFTEWLFFSLAMISPRRLMIPRRKYMLDVDPDKPHVADWISGCAMMLKRDAIEKAGVFDEKMFLFYEDTELCHRMNEMTGKVFYYFPGARIIHLGGGSYEAGGPRQVRYSFRSACYYFNKTAGMRSAMLFRTMTRFSWAITLLVLAAADMLTLRRNRRMHRKLTIYVELLKTTANCIRATTEDQALNAS